MQFKSLLTDDEFRTLAEFLSDYPDVGLRAYGSLDGSIRDLEFLRWFPQLRSFAADSMWRSLESLDGLNHLPADLRKLTLGSTKRRLSLRPLARFTDLRRLYLEGQTKDIDVLSGLTSIRSLTLRSITLPDLSLLVPMTGLHALDLKLGGTTNLDRLPAFASLVYLEIWMVRAFSDLAPLADVTSLEALHLQSLRQVTTLPSFEQMPRLNRVHLETMKGLRDLSPLLTAQGLEDLLLIAMTQLQLSDVAVLANHPSLKRARLGLGSTRKNEAASAALGLPKASGVRHPALDGMG